MPPRYVYWTILIDNKPTAFRARVKEELLPTFNQLRRTNRNVVFKWFARGRLWDTPEQAVWAAKHLPAPREKRGREWRPGGEHRDPRQRFAHGRKKGATDQRRDKSRQREQEHEAAKPSSPRDESGKGKRPTAPEPWSGKKQSSKPAARPFKPTNARPQSERRWPKSQKRESPQKNVVPPLHNLAPLPNGPEPQHRNGEQPRGEVQKPEP